MRRATFACMAVALSGCSALFPFDTGGDTGDAGRFDGGEPRDAHVDGAVPDDGAMPDGAMPDDGGVPEDGAWTDLALGRQFSCGIRAPGNLYCWGFGSSGRLADASGVDRSAPFPVSVPGLALEVEAGANHACAIVGDSDATSIVCWGVSVQGQAGIVQTSVTVPSAIALTGATGSPVQLALGDEHSCARTDDGQVWCWGNDENGQLGDLAAGGIRAEAMPVTLAADAIDLSSGNQHVCALLEDGTLSCWGSNDVGQLAAMAEGSVVQAPNTLTGFPPGLIDVELGGNLTCALDGGRRIHCRGQANNGQIPTERGIVGVNELEPLGTQQLAVGIRQLCALDDMGVVRCWGEASALGRATPGSGILTPGPVDLPADATLVASGFRHTCVARGTALSCFGIDGAGQTGRGAALVQRTPMRVEGLSANPSRVSAGEQSTCALLNDSTVACWGDGAFGRLGYGSSSDSSSPQRVVTSTGPTLSGALDVVVSYRNACATVDEATWCWGGASDNQLGDSLMEESNPGALEVRTPVGWTGGLDLGDRFACWLTDAGTVGCVGNNDSMFEQLGRTCPSPCGDYQTTSVAIVSPIYLALGDAHVCVAAGSQLLCWGQDDRQQLGGASIPYDLPSPVFNLDAGENTTCAALANGTVHCWGDNRGGQVGAGGDDIREDIGEPTPIASIEDASQVAVGSQFACALTDGTIQCWGDDTFGQLGRGAPASSRGPLAVLLPPGSVALSVSAGHQHACAVLDIDETKSVYCWGSDRNGRLGHGRALILPSPGEVTVLGEP